MLIFLPFTSSEVQTVMIHQKKVGEKMATLNGEPGICERLR